MAKSERALLVCSSLRRKLLDISNEIEQVCDSGNTHPDHARYLHPRSVAGVDDIVPVDGRLK